MAKILLVDDSESLRIQLKKNLSGAGHEVVEAGDGVQGLAALNANKDVKLVICDVNMPNMDGLTMCAKVAADPALNKIPIFMLTTETSDDVKAKGKQIGVRAWIAKPCPEDKLMMAVSKILAA
jgi:two-component system chemotaxis response regulator CheY